LHHLLPTGVGPVGKRTDNMSPLGMIPMQFPHLFEWMDLERLPASLRNTMREILECGNARPFRPYYSWVAREVKRRMVEEGYQNAVELGAGTAPITRLLARDPDLQGMRLIVCDLKPDVEGFRGLEARYPGRVTPEYEPVDFSQPRTWPPKTLLFLSGTFHHLPPAGRSEVLRSLTNSAERTMMFEPLRKTLVSVIFVFFSIFPALFLPLWFITRPGRLRRVFWCWLVPLAPILFWWDGVVSCLRMWSDKQWDEALRQIRTPTRERTIRHCLFSQLVSW
jgi:hypothetical protein